MLSRPNSIEAVSSEEFDVVVIGGGVTGAGVALDAASRGYTVALLERRDWAAGTSSRSSKMVHGGLRYLQNFDLGLVREALMERQLMVQMAPHLVYPTPFLVPTLGDERRDRKIGIGLNMYDVMASVRAGGSRKERATRAEAADYWSPDRHRTIDGGEAVDLIPALGPRDPSQAYLFYDCQTDDARLVLTILGEADRFGAVMLNGVDVTDLLEENGKVTGVVCAEAETGERMEVRAANVVNATGVWADRLRPDEIHDQEEIPRIEPSRGTHVTVSQEDLEIGRAACIVPAGEGRAIFALPWYGRTLLGTTDRDYDGELDYIEPSGDDIQYLLDATNSHFGTALGREQITGAYAGVRPLIATGDPRKSVDISRKAELYETSSGMLTITGGKLTTWRRMAKHVVDRMVEREGREAPCRTADLPLGMPAEQSDLDPRGRARRCDAKGDEVAARISLRPVFGKGVATGGGAPGIGPADRGRPARFARRSACRHTLRAGALRRRRPAAQDPVGAARRAAAANGGVRASRCSGNGRGAGLGRRAASARRPTRGSRKRAPKASTPPPIADLT